MSQRWKDIIFYIIAWPTFSLAYLFIAGMLLGIIR
jgi:hypothetical protein